MVHIIIKTRIPWDKKKMLSIIPMSRRAYTRNAYLQSLAHPTVGAGAAPAGSAFLGRTGGHERLLEAGGGDAATEGAVRMALAWLARHQSGACSKGMA